jgi:hypothetical protein
MTVNDFIKILQKLKPSLLEGEVLISCPNGLLVEPKIKMLFNPETGEIETKTILTWQ